MTALLQRRGTAAQWASANPVLAAGQFGVDTTNKIVKVGDGFTAWASLPTYGMTGPASSVDNTVVRFNGTNAKVFQGSTVTISDTGDFAGVKDLTMSGALDAQHVYAALSLRRTPVVVANNNAVLGALTNSMVDMSTGATNRTCTLPSTTTPGILITIVKIDAGAGTVTVVGTINGATNKVLTGQYAKVTVRSTGTSGVWYEV